MQPTSSCHVSLHALLPPRARCRVGSHATDGVSSRQLMAERRLSRLQCEVCASANVSSSQVQPDVKLAVVTGSNKGIGVEIARGLALRPGWRVVACARDAAKGEAAVARLVAEGVPSHALEFRLLDINDDDSIQSFVGWFNSTYPCGLSALVNNAAIQIEAGDLAPPFAEQAAPTMHTNLDQTVHLTEALRSSFTETARVVCVASMAVRP